jgi:hypothetical protein
MRPSRVIKRVRAVGVAAGAAFVLMATALPAHAAVPTITSMFPPNPAPGCVASLTGTNFQTVANGGPVSLVQFGAQPAAGPVAIDADTQLEATVPAALPASTASTVTVTNVTGASLPFVFATGAASACPGVPTPTPATGAVGSTVTLTGSFVSVPFAVRFNNVNATITGAPSAALVTVIVPSGAPSPSTIRVYTTAGVGSATIPFIPTGGAPTITSFTPTSGAAGTVVTITGTNFTGATSVKFNNVSSTSVTINSATQITATVPSGATTGKISVTTPSGTGTSATDFTVAGVKHERKVTLDLNKHINAKGKVNAPDGTTACESNQTVKLQKQKKDGSWKTIEKDVTDSSGSYSQKLPDKTGKYRARAPEVTLANGDVCLADASPKVKHSHG